MLHRVTERRVSRVTSKFLARAPGRMEITTPTYERREENQVSGVGDGIRRLGIKRSAWHLFSQQ